MNSHALEMLGKGQINIAFQILFKCEEIYKRTLYKFDTSLAILTLNHLACCYKQIGQPKISRRILDDATHLLFKKNIICFRAITYLNKCAVLSMLDMHEKALENARIAAEYFEKEILNMDIGESVKEAEFRLEFLEKIRLLAICYYNLSVEADIVKDASLCTQGIRQALRLYYFFLEDDPNMISLYRK
jgi:tetratricopeptide (TPR) repeat protein